VVRWRDSMHNRLLLQRTVTAPRNKKRIDCECVSIKKRIDCECVSIVLYSYIIQRSHLLPWREQPGTATSRSSWRWLTSIHYSRLTSYFHLAIWYMSRVTFRLSRQAQLLLMVALCVTENDHYALRRAFFPNKLSPPSLKWFRRRLVGNRKHPTTFC